METFCRIIYQHWNIQTRKHSTKWKIIQSAHAYRVCIARNLVSRDLKHSRLVKNINIHRKMQYLGNISFGNEITCRRTQPVLLCFTKACRKIHLKSKNGKKLRVFVKKTGMIYITEPTTRPFLFPRNCQ